MFILNKYSQSLQSDVLQEKYTPHILKTNNHTIKNLTRKLSQNQLDLKNIPTYTQVYVILIAACDKSKLIIIGSQ